MIDAPTLRAFEAIAPTSTDEPLSRHTTIGIGGPADAYAVATSADQIRDLLNVARDAGLPFFILGSGSNIVVGDRGIRGLTIENKATNLSAPMPLGAFSHSDPMPRPSGRDIDPPSATPLPSAPSASDLMPRGSARGIDPPPATPRPSTSTGSDPMPRDSDRSIDPAPATPRPSAPTGSDPMPLGSARGIEAPVRGTDHAPGATALPTPPPSTPKFLLRAESGCSFALTARHLAFDGLEGMEWGCGIPGTIGGAVVYNAGAYGGCLGDILQRIAVWDPDESERIIEAADLALTYRSSAFTKGMMAGRAVLWAEFVLWTGDATALRARIADYDSRRLKAQPRGRNAGSFFKNPPEQPAWRLLDAVGMRGYQIGGARFSDKHCNFLINAGDATAADVAALKSEAQRRIHDQFGIAITNEVTLVGEGFGD